MFDNLKTPKKQIDGVELFNCNRIPGFANCHLGKDVKGQPVIILSVKNDGPASTQSILLENLRVEHGIHCKISPPIGPEFSGRFSILHCTSSDRDLHIYFLQIMNVILKYINDDSPANELSIAINKLARLFHALSKPASQTTQGLWAELYLIVQSRNPRIMIESWHTEATEIYDFNYGNQCVEVKCSSKRMRQHFFSYEQVYPPLGSSVLVASLFVEPTANGTTLGELWDKARDFALSEPDLRIKIENVCLDALGSTWINAREKAYDLELARHSISFFNIDDIPRISKRNPKGVSEIRFRSDLSHVNPININSYNEYGSLFNACIAS